jgi:hypothetical protein
MNDSLNYISRFRDGPTRRVGITEGRRYRVRMPHSEVCMHMKIAGKEMLLELTLTPCPMVQLFQDGRPFSSKLTPGEAGTG